MIYYIGLAVPLSFQCWQHCSERAISRFWVSPKACEIIEDMMMDECLKALQKRLPNLLAVYAFGSRVEGTDGPDSDLDIAVLVAGYADPLLLFTWAGELSDVVGCSVDLLDFRAASTVMQYQILIKGQRLWAKDVRADLFEVFVLGEKMRFDEARFGLLDDIQKQGTVYGR